MTETMPEPLAKAVTSTLDDLGVPGRKYTFGILKAAQARGDFLALAERHLPALRVPLGPEVAAGLDQLQRAFPQVRA